MDEEGKSQLGADRAPGLDAMLESNNPGSVSPKNSKLDLLEVGDANAAACRIDLEFNTRSQTLGQDRDIPLLPSDSYNSAHCGTKRVEIERCSLGTGVAQIAKLRNYVQIVEAD